MIELERVDFVSIPTRNAERARQFYGETLGLPVSVERLRARKPVDVEGRTEARAKASPDTRARITAMTPATLAPSEVEVEHVTAESELEKDRPWVVIVWNDPINLMSYVTFVLQKLFGYSRERATRLMLQVHHEGKAVVASGTREKGEYDVARLHAHGLWATMRQD